jgi:phosphate transport system substrate-binding protein
MRLRTRTGLALGCAGAISLSPLTFAATSAGAAPTAATALITASGSSWAANAVNQWVADVASEGLQVVYTPDGDAQGRQDFANRTSTFAVTSIGYQGLDPVTGVNDTSQGRPYAYLPIAAGGTSFPYQIIVDGNQVRNLRLSGETLVKIFTNQITNWDNPEITADNNGHALPSLPIIPVVQSEGSGSTAQLTSYFGAEFPTIWKAYSGSTGMTEYWPAQGNQIAQNGSNGAMNYVSSSVANGAIGYVEYSYPLAQNYPVVKMLNNDGYYTLPTQYNVAVALEDAVINMDKSSPDYLLQNLDHVYTDPDPRTYPLSSYVYMIEPTGAYPNPESQVTTAMRQTLADFAYYSICQGQREIGPIGYSPLPVNLVEAAFGQIQKLQVAAPGISLQGLDISTCDNPTFVPGHPDTNYLAKIAPLPPACDKTGAGPCAAGVTPTGPGSGSGGSGSGGSGGSGSGGSGSGSGGSGSGSGSGSGGSGSGSGSGGSGSGSGSGSGGGSSSNKGSGSGSSGITTGGTTGTTTGGTTSTTTGGSAGTGGSTGVGTEGNGGSQVAGDTAAPIVNASLGAYTAENLTGELAPVAAGLLLLVFVVPAVVAVYLARRRRYEDFRA